MEQRHATSRTQAFAEVDETEMKISPTLRVEWLLVDSLRMLDSPRLGGEDSQHTQMLASLDVEVPPIIVHRATMRVIDGAHRLGAARLRGDDLIKAAMFEGTEQEAFVLGVKANVTHGLPLSTADRTRAAERIIESYPTWSDRTIAASSGLSARTVGSIRRRLELAGGIWEGSRSRIGRDGRTRPLDNTEGRLKAVSYIQRQPEASLREIAKNAGVSPSTARDVRNRLQRGEDPVPGSRRPADRDNDCLELKDEPSRLEPTLRSMLQGLKNDPSLRFTESGRGLLRWIFARAIQDNEWKEVVEAVPPHCSFVLANVARRCSQEWLEFAETIEKNAAA